MIEKFFSLLERLVIAVEKLAGEAPVPKGTTAQTEPTAPKLEKKRGRPAKETPPPAEAESNGLDDEPVAESEDSGLGDDDGFPVDEPEEKPATTVKVTKELMREKMLEYQGMTDGNAARELLKANTSTKSVAFNTVKEAEYAQVYKATLKAIAAKKK
jgi:hypothetical protein